MAEETKTKQQTYHDDVEALKADGMNNADAVRAVAEKYSVKENAVRGGIHQYRTRHLDGGAPTGRTRRRSAATVDDYVANARQALEEALSLVDKEVDEAKAALDAAQARYDEVAASVKDRKADIERKLKAVSS